MNSKSISLLVSCYHGEKYLSSFFDNVLQQTIFSQIEIIMILNDPSEIELSAVNQFKKQHHDHIQFQIVQPVESLGRSWNRAWNCADGKYIGMWNIDDQRIPDSLEKQVYLLEQHPEISMVYGDYVTVPQYGIQKGLRRITPGFKKSLFSREFPSGGAFLMWRRSIGEEIGYFDEQLSCACDFDLVVRLVVAGHRMMKSEGVLGFFTDAQQGLSTLGEKAQIERTVIQYRYGTYDLIRPQWKAEAQKYELTTIENFSKKIMIEKLVPGYSTILKENKYLWFLGFFRIIVRKMLRRMSLLSYVYGWINKNSFKQYNP